MGPAVEAEDGAARASCEEALEQMAAQAGGRYDEQNGLGETFQIAVEQVLELGQKALLAGLGAAPDPYPGRRSPEE